MAPDDPALVRSCDGCTMCCKLMRIDAIDKPQNVWCRYCARGEGCGIYETRPEACREFHCLYLLNQTLTPAWKPSECKFVMRHEPGGGGRISIYVDTTRPEAWRREPFLSTFHTWARLGAEHQAQVVVFVGRHAYVVLPDRVADLGAVAPDELILTLVTRTPQGVRLEPFKAGRDDPRAQQFLAANPHYRQRLELA